MVNYIAALKHVVTPVTRHHGTGLYTVQYVALNDEVKLPTNLTPNYFVSHGIEL
jgi:hypothetical protein